MQTLAWIFMGLFILVIARMVYVPKETPSEIARRQVSAINPSTEPVDPSVERGREIADRLAQECDYWDILKYNPDGTVTAVKSIYIDWGRKWTMMIPRSSWNSLSISDKNALANYASKEQRVVQIIVGEVRPSPRIEGNTISVDEIVWP